MMHFIIQIAYYIYMVFIQKPWESLKTGWYFNKFINNFA